MERRRPQSPYPYFQAGPAEEYDEEVLEHIPVTVTFSDQDEDLDRDQDEDLDMDQDEEEFYFEMDPPVRVPALERPALVQERPATALEPPAPVPPAQGPSENVRYVTDLVRRTLMEWELQGGQGVFPSPDVLPQAVGVGRVTAGLVNSDAQFQLRISGGVGVDDGEQGRIVPMLILLLEEQRTNMPPPNSRTSSRPRLFRSALLKFYKSLEDIPEFLPHTISEVPLLIDSELEPIMQQFVCPVCMDTCFPPIMTCLRGHLICWNCKIRIFERPRHLPTVTSGVCCPTCRIRGRPEARGSPDLEQVIGSMEFRCLFHERGCGLILTGSGFTAHVREDCIFRPWKCIFCDEVLTLETAEVHMSSHHNGDRIASRDIPKIPEFEFPVGYPFSSFMHDLAQLPTIGFATFKIRNGFGEEAVKDFICLQLKTDRLQLAWIICLIGTAEEARSYRFTSTLTTFYDLGGSVPSETRTRAWTDTKIFSFQQEFKDLIENVAKEYADYEMPMCMYDACHSEDATEAHFQSTLKIEIKKTENGN